MGEQVPVCCESLSGGVQGCALRSCGASLKQGTNCCSSFFSVFYDTVSAFVLFFFFTSALWDGTRRQKEAVVSLIPENLLCRKTCRCVQDGEGVAALMTQPALHAEGQRVMGMTGSLLCLSPFP